MKVQLSGQPQEDVDGMQGLIDRIRQSSTDKLFPDSAVAIVRTPDLRLYDGWSSIVSVQLRGIHVGFCEDPGAGDEEGGGEGERIMRAIREFSSK